MCIIALALYAWLQFGLLTSPVPSRCTDTWEGALPTCGCGGRAREYRLTTSPSALGLWCRLPSDYVMSMIIRQPLVHKWSQRTSLLMIHQMHDIRNLYKGPGSYIITPELEGLMYKFVVEFLLFTKLVSIGTIIELCIFKKKNSYAYNRENIVISWIILYTIQFQHGLSSTFIKIPQKSKKCIS